MNALRLSRESAEIRHGEGTRAPGTHVVVALPTVPVLAGTLLGLDLLLQRPAFDLRVACDLLREDPGALLQLFLLLGEEYPIASDRPVRLEEVVASLSGQRLLQAFSAAGGAGRAQSRFRAFARHGAAVGKYARLVAESLGLDGELPSLVGLLHDLGSLPAVLGWPAAADPTWSPATTCAELCLLYRLPAALSGALKEVHPPASPSVWCAVLAAAHDLARERHADAETPFAPGDNLMRASRHSNAGKGDLLADPHRRQPESALLLPHSGDMQAGNQLLVGTLAAATPVLKARRTHE